MDGWITNILQRAVDLYAPHGEKNDSSSLPQAQLLSLCVSLSLSHSLTLSLSLALQLALPLWL